MYIINIFNLIILDSSIQQILESQDYEIPILMSQSIKSSKPQKKLQSTRKSTRKTKNMYSSTNFSTQSQSQKSQRSETSNQQNFDQDSVFDNQSQLSSNEFDSASNTNATQNKNVYQGKIRAAKNYQYEQLKPQKKRRRKLAKRQVEPQIIYQRPEEIPQSQNQDPSQGQFCNEKYEDNNNIQFTEQLDYEVAKIFYSYFRTKNIPNQVIIKAKQKMLDHIKRLLSTSIERFIMLKNKNLFGVSDLLKTISRFDEKYKHKIARTFIIEDMQGKYRPNNNLM